MNIRYQVKIIHIPGTGTGTGTNIDVKVYNGVTVVANAKLLLNS